MMHIIDIRSRLGVRSLIFVGLMGAGKTTVGRSIAQVLNMPFYDADHEIESLYQMTITELFSHYGEEKFRILERRAISQLLQLDSIVLATGGGAFIQYDTRQIIIRGGISIWLKADLDSLMNRISLTNDRPLLHVEAPRDIMQKFIKERYSIYAKADMIIENGDTSLDKTVDIILSSLKKYFCSN